MSNEPTHQTHLTAHIDHPGDTLHPHEDDHGLDRRHVLRRLLIGTAGVGALAAVARPGAAAAANNDPLRIGATDNTADLPTLSTYTSAGTNGVAFQFRSGTASGTAIDDYPAVVAGYATSTGLRNGVYGLTQQVYGAGLVGNGDHPAAAGALFSGGRAALRLVPGVKTDGYHLRGDVVMTADALYLCVEEGQPGTFRELAGRSSAGAFHFLPAPVRVYDSRDPASTTSAGGVGGRLDTGSTLTIAPVIRPEGAPAGTNLLAGATGLMISLTVTDTVARGFLTLFPDGRPRPNASSTNWFQTDQITAVTTTTAVGATGAFQVYAGGGGSAHVIVDVIGWYA